MQGKTGADDFAVSGPGNQIVELRLDQLQPGGPGVDMEEVVVVERRVIIQFGPDNGVLGVIVGFVFKENCAYIGFIGTVFIRLLFQIMSVFIS